MRCVRNASGRDTGRSECSTIPETFSLEPSYPNPFNPVTTVLFNLPETEIVKLSIYDSLGREVDVLVNEKLVAGEHRIEWHAGLNPSGVYLCQMTTKRFVNVRKMNLIR